MQAATSNPTTRLSALRLTAIVLIAAVLRIAFLGARSFWADEIVSVKLATDNWGGFWFWIGNREANMALYYLLLRGWVKGGDGEAWVRLLSALFGIATVPLLHRLITRLYDERAAWICALLAATSACLVQFSQEARSYSLLILLIVASYYFFVQWLEEQRSWLGVAYVLVSAAALYAHFFAALVICSQAVSLLWLPLRSVPWRRLAAAWSAVAAAALPIAYYILKRDVGQLYWVRPTTVDEIYKLTVFYAGGSKAVAAVLSVLSLAVIATAVADNRKTLAAKGEESWRFQLIFLWAVLPVVLTVLVSLHKPIFVHRYLLVALPGYLTLIALGLARIRKQLRLYSALGVFIALSGISIAQEYRRPIEDWRGVVEHVLSHARPEDSVLLYMPYGVNNFVFYTIRREREEAHVPLGRLEPVDSVAQLQAIDSPRAWLILCPSPHVAKDAPLFKETLEERYSSLEPRQFRGIEVLLFSGLKQPPSRLPGGSAPRR